MMTVIGDVLVVNVMQRIGFTAADYAKRHHGGYLGRLHALKHLIMKKIICIGECSLNIVLGADGKPAGSLPGGRVLNAAAILARDSFEVLMASEVSADAVGDIIVRFSKTAV